MHLKPAVIWFLVLMLAFALGFFLMRTFLRSSDTKVQNQNAPQTPTP